MPEPETHAIGDPNPVEAFRKRLTVDRAASRRMSYAELDRLALVRSNLLVAVAWGCVVASPLALAVVVETRSQLILATLPTWALWASAIVGAFACFIVVWGSALFLAQTLGVSISEDGVLIVGRRLFSRRFPARFVPWGEMREAEPTGMLGHSVMVNWGGAPIWLTANQARAVLTDSRYPLHGSVSSEVRKRIGLRG